MRQTKFRARWKDTGKVIPDFMEDYTMDAINDEGFIVEQWTGLLDKNEVEIYEGDIVKTDNVLKPFVVKDIRIDTLKIARRIAFERKNPTAYRFRVIGNIYENPELLKASPQDK